MHPPLTTVSQPIYDIGGTVCEMLIGLVKGEAPEQQQIILKPSLIVRQSTGIPMSRSMINPIKVERR
jgi:LacI family transcriptional regulator